MLDHIIEQAREEGIFSREDTSTEQRVLAGFMYHAGLSFRRIEPFVDVCHVAVHDWPLDLLECEGKQETWGDRSLIEAWFSVLKYRTVLFRHRFPHYSTRESTESWLTAFAALHNVMLQS